MAAKPRVLIVEDEAAFRELLSLRLARLGWAVEAAASAEQALARLEAGAPDLLLTDLRLPGMSGEALLKACKTRWSGLPVGVVSAYGSARDVAALMRLGAEDYLPKPFEDADLQLLLLRVRQRSRLAAENKRLRRELGGGDEGLLGLLGRSKAMLALFDQIRRLAPSEAPVLILGESGSGKELVARALHELSPRASRSFVDLNAAALPATLLESELFGAKKGAYTGATETRGGLFQAADQGTLFLDEIAELPLESQPKLLRVLETGEVRMLGGSKGSRVDVRLLAATAQDLSSAVGRKAFRQDLYYRLNVLTLRVPPLRERLEDLPLLSSHFLRLAALKGSQPKRLSGEASRALLSYRWPGNVRELRNVLSRAALLSRGAEIKAEDLVFETGTSSTAPQGNFAAAKRAVLEEFEARYLRAALEASQGNVSHAAREAGLDRKNFQVLCRKHRLRGEDFKPKLR